MSVQMPGRREHDAAIPAKHSGKARCPVANMDLGKQTPRCEEVLKFPWRLVVVPLDEMDGLASQLPSMLRHVPGAAETEVSDEV
jgi:hypothetical protein